MAWEGFRETEVVCVYVYVRVCVYMEFKIFCL